MNPNPSRDQNPYKYIAKVVQIFEMAKLFEIISPTGGLEGQE